MPQGTYHEGKEVSGPKAGGERLCQKHKMSISNSDVVCEYVSSGVFLLTKLTTKGNIVDTIGRVDELRLGLR